MELVPRTEKVLVLGSDPFPFVSDPRQLASEAPSPGTRFPIKNFDYARTSWVLLNINELEFLCDLSSLDYG